MRKNITPSHVHSKIKESGTTLYIQLLLETERNWSFRLGGYVKLIMNYFTYAPQKKLVRNDSKLLLKNHNFEWTLK